MFHALNINKFILIKSVTIQQYKLQGQSVIYLSVHWNPCCHCPCVQMQFLMSIHSSNGMILSWLFSKQILTLDYILNEWKEQSPTEWTNVLVRKERKRRHMYMDE